MTLAEFGLEEEASGSTSAPANWRARRWPSSRSTGAQRWVLGSVGPGTKLPTLGNIAYQRLEEALATQCAGLIAGGVDAILIETCQDPCRSRRR